MRLVPLSLFILTALCAQDWMNQGVSAFKNARYAEAIAAFQKAVDLNPNDSVPHLYLGTAYLSQYIPGADSSENALVATNAETEFRRVLDLDSSNAQALGSLASLKYQQAQAIRQVEEKARKLDEARDLYRKLADADPQNREAPYALGVIAWSKAYAARMAARRQIGMNPEDPGPLSISSVRLPLKSQYGPTIDEGISNLEQALRIDPNYDDAMAYLNLLFRERADLADSPMEYQRDITMADDWVQKALAAKKVKADKWYSPSGNLTPPPPPPPSGQATGQTPQRIRVGANVEAANLIYKVPPIYPSLARQARIQGTVRFSVVIGNDGRVDHLQLISGHPLLVSAAQEAVRQWVYKPTLLNGSPVEVVTQVDVNFTLEP